jgi:hypothetical protein
MRADEGASTPNCRSPHSRALVWWCQRSALRRLQRRVKGLCQSNNARARAPRIFRSIRKRSPSRRFQKASQSHSRATTAHGFPPPSCMGAILVIGHSQRGWLNDIGYASRLTPSKDRATWRDRSSRRSARGDRRSCARSPNSRARRFGEGRKSAIAIAVARPVRQLDTASPTDLSDGRQHRSPSTELTPSPGALFVA